MPRFRNPVVSTADILDGSITTPKLADDAVTEPKVAASAITEAKIALGAVTTQKLADLAVEAAKLASSSVTATKIANAAVGTAAIANAAITTALIANLAVTTAKIDNLAVTDAKINSLTASKITAGTLSAGTINVQTDLNLGPGGIFRTASSGERVELKNSNQDRIQWFNSAGNLAGTIGLETPSSSTLKLFGTGQLVLNAGSTDMVRLSGTTVTVNGKLSVVFDNTFLANKVQTGQTSFTQEPWSPATIALGNFGSVGTQGSFRTYLAWNWERGTDSGFYHLNVNGFPEASSVYAGRDGVVFQYDPVYGAAGNPTERARINDNGIMFNGDTDTYIEGNAANQISAQAGGNRVWTIGTTGFHLNLTHALGDTSGLFIGEDFRDIGNHETLRADRTAGGTGSTEVGYFSSRRSHKREVVPLARSKMWRREWIDELRPVKYRRRSTQGREFGFIIEDLAEIGDGLGRYLTTKGDEVGHSPDEFALLAVAIDAIQDLRARVATLEAA